VGSDIFGPSVKKNFESLGIDTRYVDVVSGVSNGVAPIFVDSEGNNSILIVKGANNFLSAKDIDRAADDIKHCGLIILQLEVQLDTVYYAIEWGAKNGVPVILNPAPAAELDYNYVRKITFFVPNETELETITGMPVSTMDEISAAARSLVKEGVRNVIVTLGSKGSLYVAEGREEPVPPYTVKSVDSTGAGDAFIGSFAHYYLKTGDVIEAMKTANRYAALSTMKPGTQKSFPTLKKFEKAGE
jgi:ribokinase